MTFPCKKGCSSNSGHVRRFDGSFCSNPYIIKHSTIRGVIENMSLYNMLYTGEKKGSKRYTVKSYCISLPEEMTHNLERQNQESELFHGE
jgi:hypothetical protein